MFPLFSLGVCVRRLSWNQQRIPCTRDIKSTASLSFFLDFFFLSFFLVSSSSSFFVVLECESEGTRKRNFVNFSRPSWDGLMETVGVYREQHRSVGSEREGLNFLKCKVCMFSLSLFNYDWYFRSLASLPLPSFFFSYRNLRGVIFKRKEKKV